MPEVMFPVALRRRLTALLRQGSRLTAWYLPQKATVTRVFHPCHHFQPLHCTLAGVCLPWDPVSNSCMTWFSSSQLIAFVCTSSQPTALGGSISYHYVDACSTAKSKDCSKAHMIVRDLYLGKNIRRKAWLMQTNVILW
jgi:hypothetical protein